VDALGDTVANGVNSDGAERTSYHNVEDCDLFRCELFLRGHFILLEVATSELGPSGLKPNWSAALYY
jgi:hypothetical protein